MGLYAFRCPGCGAELEKRVPFADSDKVCCEKGCGPMERLISTPQPGRVDGQHRAGAYMKDGSFVPGHFGKTAKKYVGLN